MTEERIEIYRQRYETFRHLDKLRWQMLQILVAVASATAVLLRYKSDPFEWWLFFLLGALLIVVGVVMIRIGRGIQANNIVLKKAAEAIGDDGIPDLSNHWKSVAHWIAVFVFVSGVVLVVASICVAFMP
ncbi:MAG: DUF1772 domain-containing protein [Ectothiorhodospiraceae bacterium AqS1]|nr:DUF1772 domain-containing protein [Ectothiorhodospiraceae bacterium AqS1]